MRRSGDGDDQSGISRREFLEASTAGALGTLLLGCGSDTETGGVDANGSGADAALELADASPPDAAPIPIPDETLESAMFGLGVASGDVTATSAVVWCRYDGSASLRVVVWEMDGEDYVRVAHQEQVVPTVAGFVHVEAMNLASGKHHRYAFFETDAEGVELRSPIGRFRAAIAEDAMEPLVIGATSCSNNGRSFDTLSGAGARTDLDVFVLIGDTVYADGAETVSEYRDKWRENLGSQGYLALRQSTSLIATWDDHEVGDNWNPETIDPLQMNSARQAFFENLPVRRSSEEPDRLWKSLRWGRTAEMFVLDCRSERKPSTRGDTDEYLSRAQMDWLTQALLGSPAVFKLIVNSVPISNFPLVFDVAANDRWEGYPTQRTEILDYIDQNGITGVLWLAGDFHLASVGRVDTAGPGANQIEALCGPAAQTGNPLAFVLPQPQFDFGTTTNNYTTIELDPATGQATLTWIDASGSAFETHTFVL